LISGLEGVEFVGVVRVAETGISEGVDDWLEDSDVETEVPVDMVGSRELDALVFDLDAPH
jgi:hypothetical protein